jgi:hypothetical protein
MSKILVYGDSYSAWFSIGDGWASKVAKKLGIDEVYNQSVAGSGTHFSMKNFYNDICKNKINDGDIVIFVISTMNRLFFEHQMKDRPDTASMYLHKPPENKGKFSPRWPGDNSWYYENKDHIEWWMVNASPVAEELSQAGYIHTIKNYASTRPNCKFIVIKTVKLWNMIDLGTPVSNFFYSENLLLDNIARNEVISDSAYNYWDWSEFVINDPRVNHMTNQNLEILADAITNTLVTGDTYHMNSAVFKKQNIKKITNKSQYMEYVQNGTLYIDHSILEVVPE